MLSSLEPRKSVAALSHQVWAPIAAILESNQQANRDAMWPKNNEMAGLRPALPASAKLAPLTLTKVASFLKFTLVRLARLKFVLVKCSLTSSYSSIFVIFLFGSVWCALVQFS